MPWNDPNLPWKNNALSWNQKPEPAPADPVVQGLPWRDTNLPWNKQPA